MVAVLVAPVVTALTAPGALGPPPGPPGGGVIRAETLHRAAPAALPPAAGDERPVSIAAAPPAEVASAPAAIPGPSPSLPSPEAPPV
ncbi:MAG: hypothetical protein M3357_10250, partial [Actinomycetota bacterium]|nr:hypothetical protein [Actinomycetota bacterium]